MGWAFFFSSRRRHTRWTGDWSSDVCSSDLTNWHIRIPFIIEGVIEGLLGAGAAIVGLFIIKVAFFDSLRKSVAFMPWIGTPAVVHAIPWLLTGGVVIAV